MQAPERHGQVRVSGTAYMDSLSLGPPVIIVKYALASLRDQPVSMYQEKEKERKKKVIMKLSQLIQLD